MSDDKKINVGTKNREITEDARKLVIARVKAASNNLRISIGSNEYTKNELLKALETDNELSREIIDIQLKYLKDLAEGAIYRGTE